MWSFIRPSFTHYSLVSTAANVQGLLWPCQQLRCYMLCLSPLRRAWAVDTEKQVWFCVLSGSEPRSDWIYLVCLLSFSYNFATFSHKKKGWSALKMNKMYFWSEFQYAFKGHLGSVTWSFGEGISLFGGPEIGCHDMNWWPLCFCFESWSYRI